MKKSLIAFVLIGLVSCGSSKGVVKKDAPPTKKPSVVAKNVVLGWSDPNTYTVKATGSDKSEAKDRARHRILKDIVNVRVRNGSRYTDITKISSEFETPLQTGKVLQSQDVDGGVEIYFQIRDRGLKKKFERQ